MVVVLKHRVIGLSRKFADVVPRWGAAVLRPYKMQYGHLRVWRAYL